ncbi:SEC14 [Geosmithia morbida]|uniref:SEC14 n=1 Tax=Geosmithia morbida TaxID=1094350 RepID=A0A9P5D0Z6_9HYPO|nr:SEC14 [Geosmithia morbida]KAF4119941.1 SEC14 [Geosmithia morbida]
MSPSETSGHLGHLTVEEERKLQQVWANIIRLFGDQNISQGKPDCRGNGDLKMTGTSPKSGQLSLIDTAPDRIEEYRKIMTSKSPQVFKKRFWESIKAYNPDSIILRFLRARKWDVGNATTMLVSAINWRDEIRIEETIINRGESVMFETSHTQCVKDFVAQYKSGKSYVRGTDKDLHPVYVIKVKLHDPHAQSSQTMESYVLHNIESIRLLVREPNDKACLIFDLTGFGLRNMDFHLVKFMIQVFESRYPETLGLVLVHNAPFIFWGIWSVIKGWLDPVIASKIHFTRGNGDIERFIANDRRQKSYGGDDTWEYKYVEPVKGENALMEDTVKRDEIQAEREALAIQYEKETIQWMAFDPDSKQGKNCNTRRMEIATKLRDNYWSLDPYVRARTYFDRIGAVENKKVLNFDPVVG